MEIVKDDIMPDHHRRLTTSHVSNQEILTTRPVGQTLPQANQDVRPV